jgi:hypothetical protein
MSSKKGADIFVLKLSRSRHRWPTRFQRSRECRLCLILAGSEGLGEKAGADLREAISQRAAQLIPTPQIQGTLAPGGNLIQRHVKQTQTRDAKAFQEFLAHHLLLQHGEMLRL